MYHVLARNDVKHLERKQHIAILFPDYHLAALFSLLSSPFVRYSW